MKKFSWNQWFAIGSVLVLACACQQKKMMEQEPVPPQQNQSVDQKKMPVDKKEPGKQAPAKVKSACHEMSALPEQSHVNEGAPVPAVVVKEVEAIESHVNKASQASASVSLEETDSKETPTVSTGVVEAVPSAALPTTAQSSSSVLPLNSPKE